MILFEAQLIVFSKPFQNIFLFYEYLEYSYIKSKKIILHKSWILRESDIVDFVQNSCLP